KWREANEHKTNLETVSYFEKIALANYEFQANNVQRAVELLDECPEAMRAWEWHYLHRLCHDAPVVCDQISDAALGLAFSPDGKRIAVWGQPELMIADATTGKSLWRATTPDSSIYCGAWHPTDTEFITS